MRALLLALFLAVAAALPARAQIPPEWEAAAKVVIGTLEVGTPRADRPWTHETRSGWNLARTWRQHNNRNTEIIFAEYLTFTELCRAGCGGSLVAGRGYAERAAEVKALIAENGGSYGLAANAHRWLAGLDDPTGAAAKNVALWDKDKDVPSADFATGNLYALYWILARAQPTPAAQAATFAQFALFVQGRAWIGARCLDISKIATNLDAPPQIATCG
ncbi:MAG: hypothetical protein JSR24_10715 [Proteobacteria bacterium]|nr:hypothetical protein [Pseudomonadota bacterium]